MIQLVTNIQVSILVQIDAVAVSECGRASRISLCASDSSHGCDIGPISRPSLDPIVGRVKDVNERAGDEDVRRRVQLIGRIAK